MNWSRYVPVSRTSHAISWVIWAVFFVNATKYIIKPFFAPRISTETYEWFHLFTILLILSIIEVIIIIIIRHFAVIKPYRTGAYNPNFKYTRFFIVYIVIWIMSNSIIFYGYTLYYLSGFYWVVYLFGAIGLSPLIYHCPRLAPFKGEKGNNKKKDVIDTPWTEVKQNSQ